MSSPLSLFLSLLLVSAVFRPYGGIVHDARLYAVQVLNHLEPDVYGKDLYLKYGSQDKYSLFSSVVRPLVKSVGVSTAFFLLYLGGHACWLFAAQRFVTTLIGRHVATWAALVYLAVNPLPFGGYETFHINENFLTPRIWAVALVIFGLECQLRGRSAAAMGWVVASMLLHPIMGFSGVCVWACWQLFHRLPATALAALMAVGACGVVGVLLYEPLGTLIFGHMDAQWRHHVMLTNCYCVPAQWPLKDWLGVAVAFVIVLMGRRMDNGNAYINRLLDSVLLLGAIGLAVGMAAPMLPYKLLLQGQPYRALWPLQFIQIPVLFSLLRHQWKGRLSPTSGCVVVLLLLLFSVAVMTAWQAFAVALTLVAIYLWRDSGRQADPGVAATLSQAAVLACVVNMVLATLSVVGAIPDVVSYGLTVSRLRTMPELMGSFFTWAAACALLILLRSTLGTGGRYYATALTGCLSIQLCVFSAPAPSPLDTLGIDYSRDVALVKSYLDHAETDGVPVLYWPLGPLDRLWIELRCNSYYSVPQTAGNMFNRGNALEGNRRLQLARRFELAARKQWLKRCAAPLRRATHRAFGHSTDGPPTLDDMLRICADTNVDLLILDMRFDGWYSATNGRVFVYDARRIRSEQLAELSDSESSLEIAASGFRVAAE